MGAELRTGLRVGPLPGGGACAGGCPRRPVRRCGCRAVGQRGARNRDGGRGARRGGARASPWNLWPPSDPYPDGVRDDGGPDGQGWGRRQGRRRARLRLPAGRDLPVPGRAAGGVLTAGYSATRAAVLRPVRADAVPGPGSVIGDPASGIRLQGRVGEGARGYAGSSPSQTRATGGWDVVEAQCLLRYHGFDPGGVDGAYGEGTVRAVERAQRRAHVTVDGEIGPFIWRVLRR
ncbi:peptidoglycan-binding domain-containing protein [Streptomyces sp. M19]